MTKQGDATHDNDAVATVKRMFAAFNAGDLDALLETVHPDSRWEYFGANPRLSHAEFKGRDRIRWFFERILSRLDISSFDDREYVVQGNTVVILGSETGTVKKTGEPFHNEWAQKYVVENGLIVEMGEWNIQVEKK